MSNIRSKNQNIVDAQSNVNPSLVLYVVLGLLTKLWLVYGVELGKDEAVYWYWGQNLDATYALLPFSALKLAHAIYPGSEIILRLVFIVSGVCSTVLIYHLCRLYELEKSICLWATAAFATSHWSWHTSSYLHPDGFVACCWLLTLYWARQSIERPSLRLYALIGGAAGAAVLCKYSCAFLAVGLFLWLWLTLPPERRWRSLGWTTGVFLLVVAPLAYAQLSSAFYLPHTLSTLSRVVDGEPFIWRLAYFLLNPLFFVSPLLLWLLYKGLGKNLWHWRRTTHAQVSLALLPALMLIAAFAFFALSRGQVKGNWILPAFLGVWPLAFQPTNLPPYRGLYLGSLVGIGGLMALGIGLTLKYPGATSQLSTILLGDRFDTSYKEMVSTPDQAREPSYSWTERLCEYHGWKAMSTALEEIFQDHGIANEVPVVSTQYGTIFALAYYQTAAARQYYTISDPRFYFLSDFDALTGRQANEVVFIIRQGMALADDLREYTKQRYLTSVPRSGGACAPIGFDVYLLTR